MCKTFLILRRIWRDVAVSVKRSYVKYRYSCRIFMKKNSLDRFSKKSQIPNFFKFSSCSIRMDRRTDMTKLIVAFFAMWRTRLKTKRPSRSAPLLKTHVITLLFRDVTQRRLIISYRLLGSIYLPVINCRAIRALLWTLDPWRWDKQVGPQRRYLINSLRCVTSQKN